jgi:hypothetical protein
MQKDSMQYLKGDQRCMHARYIKCMLDLPLSENPPIRDILRQPNRRGPLIPCDSMVNNKITS